jgi:hypothetical protein
MRRFDDEDEEPEDLTAWLAQGMRRIEAKAWRRWNFELSEAQAWRKVHVSDALNAAQWQAAGVTPETVKDWVDARISSHEAVRWHEFGYNLKEARKHTKEGRGPAEAYEYRQQQTQTRAGMRYVTMGSTGYAQIAQQQMQRFFESGVSHEIMGGYLAMQWVDDEAVAWAKQGIQALDAKIWMKIGLVPAEAKGLAEPIQVIEEWWTAGIPYAEVADWIGAGLTAAEAVEQRAAGVTRDQAAALRALRRGAP